MGNWDMFCIQFGGDSYDIPQSSHLNINELSPCFDIDLGQH